MKKRIFALLIALLSPTLIFAHGFEGGGWGNHMGFMGNGWGNHMGFMGNGWGGHMGFFGGGWLMMVLWGVVLIALVVALTRWMGGSVKRTAVGSEAQKILSDRFARGEISRDEYEEMKKVLR